MSYTAYNAHSHASPLLEGRRNSAFVNPNLRSSNVFYDYDYSYKNDMHNPRLLSSVKNDKFSTPTRDERPQSSRSFYEKSNSEQNERREPTFSTPQKRWETESNNEDRDYYQAPASRSQRGSVPNLRVGTESRVKDLESLSTIKEEPTAFNARTVKTTRGPGKYCLDCVNTSLADKQRCKKDTYKANDTHHVKEWVAEEERRAAYNHDKARQEETIARKEKIESKAHTAYMDYSKSKNAEPEGGLVIDAIFDKQEERAKQNKMNERTLRNFNLEKMVDGQANKEYQRLDRLTSEHNSLQVGEVHVNKYLPPSHTVVRDLKNQIESKAERDARNKETEQRRDQEILEANRIAIEKEKQAKFEKTENYKRMLSNQLDSRAQARDNDKERKKIEDNKARYYAQKCADDHSAGLQDKEAGKRKDKEMFMNSLKEHQVQASYRKKHDEKKSKLEGNGVTLKLGRQAELDACNGCNKKKDTNQLTHYNHKH